MGARRLKKAACSIVVCVLAGACTRPILPVTRVPPSIGSSSLSEGEWEGTTSQGSPILFTVSSDETVTTITIGYDFNGCTGSRTFSDLIVPTNPDVTCIPGPCPATLKSYRAFSYIDGSFGSGPVTQINGVFLPRNQARGQVNFDDYPGCGTATAVQWTASRR